MENTDKSNLQKEKGELDRLLANGCNLTVKDFVYKRKHFFSKLEKEEVELHFHIDEPTLSTLDRISKEAIDLEFDEKRILGSDSIEYANTFSYSARKRCAKIAALAVIGEEYNKPVENRFGKIIYKKDHKRVCELTSLFMRTLKPSALLQIVIIINTMSNLTDFLTSIRFLQTKRTAIPHLIEKED